MRAFLAFEIPDPVKHYLATLTGEMGARIAGVRWVGEEAQHLTLKFFGEINEETTKAIGVSLAHIGTVYGSVETAMGMVDAFPNRRRARVIVVTLEEGVDKIKAIFDDMENGLSTVGFEREKRGFAPHITLGRRKIPAPLLDRDIPRIEKVKFVLNKLVLFRSTLTPRGAIYNPVWDIPLKAGARD
ncbi:RNA 2',3'-cyclic phosphodiesterase [Syntrophorhabdus aromaticivorans]|uniref:RNA 2',3'-cyclic phosphodiesterase n=1 Tax=Syntrophorhabdus aromaticivorans TaxID=328301 RepID=UPI0003FB0F00|nr:RNA 2',3'-cyclic phosphodiesterase [Syntrophorhabdus aromaticivorans]HBA54561.1 RNA 2',3'-cyclic phosphodiesterase [Syntrophorhabdus aromaticivorans]